MPASYFDKLAASKGKPPPEDLPPRRLHVDPETGLGSGLDYAAPPPKWHQGARGHGEIPPPLPHPRVARADVDRPPGWRVDAAVQATPACHTRFYLDGSERQRPERPGVPFHSAHFDVVADQDTGIDWEGRGVSWLNYDDYERIDYDEIIVPPGQTQGFYPRAGGNPIVDPVEPEAKAEAPPEPPADDVVPGYKWTSFNDRAPGTATFAFDPTSRAPRVSIHPELRDWFSKVARMRPRGRDDRALLANLQGAAVAHVLREFESPGLNQAMEAAFDERLASTRKELAESRATCEEFRERVDATRSELDEQTRARADAEAEAARLRDALRDAREARAKAEEEAAALREAAEGGGEGEGEGEGEANAEH